MPQSPPTITWGPGFETLNMRVRRTCCPNNLGTMPLNSRKYLWNEMMPLLLGNIILLKEKRGVRELIHRQVDKKSRFPEEEALEGALEEEIGVWNSKGGGNDKCLFPFSLYNPSF